MSQPLAERLDYHPDPRSAAGAGRQINPRLNLLFNRLDFRDKVVLDLGCSGGAFAFELARKARKVFAVDGDAEVITRNRDIQKELGIANIEFLHARIEPDLLRRLGPVDITLFLSVYHHMLTVSEAYDWNEGSTPAGARDVLLAIHDITNTLVFEVGYPDEGYEWCERLPSYGEDWDAYVRESVFQGRYASVEVHQPPSGAHWLNRRVVARLSRSYRQDGRPLQHLKSFLGFDARDFRRIYIGTRT